jgi:superfamily I DNA and RNA helicase
MTEKSILFDLNDALQNVSEEEINNAAEMFCETKNGEEEISEASDETKRLSVLRKKFYDESKELQKKFNDLHSPKTKHDQEKCDEVYKQLKKKQKLLDLCNKLLWASVSESIDDYSKDVCLRKKWKIVSIPEKKSNIEVVSIGIGGGEITDFLDLLSSRFIS